MGEGLLILNQCACLKGLMMSLIAWLPGNDFKNVDDQ